MHNKVVRLLPAYFIILGFGIVLCLPEILFSVTPPYGDGLTHLIMSRHFTDQLWRGDFYPRWLMDMNAGFGSAVFSFYGPIPYYISAAFYPLAGNDPEGWRQLAWATAAAIIASGYSAYAWLKEVTEEVGALLASVIYMGMPYHIAFALYFRFGYAELWAFVWLPLMMLSCQKIIEGKEKHIISLAVCYALLIMTHITSALACSWVPVAYVFFLAADRLKATLLVAISIFVGTGLSAIYLVPALATQDYASFSTVWTDFRDFRHHFLFDVHDLYPTAQPFLGMLEPITAITIIFAMVAYLLTYKYEDDANKKILTFWMVMAVFAFYLMTPISKPLWEKVRVLQLLQFPWRFSILLCLATSVLVSYAVTLLSSKSNKKGALFACLVCGATAFQTFPSVFQLFNYAKVVSPPRIDNMLQVFSDQPDLVKAKFLSVKISRDIPQNRPRWVDPGFFMEATGSVGSMFALSRSFGHVKISEGSGEVKLNHWDPGDIGFDIYSRDGATVNVHQFYYPGWMASIDHHEEWITIVPSKIAGLIEFRVPPGQHEVNVTLRPTNPEKIGVVVSIVSLAAIFVIGFRQRKGISLS